MKIVISGPARHVNAVANIAKGFKLSCEEIKEAVVETASSSSDESTNGSEDLTINQTNVDSKEISAETEVELEVISEEEIEEPKAHDMTTEKVKGKSKTTNKKK